MGKQEGESRWWAHSKSSTVLLDPAAVVENWKRQIQGKDGIPLQQQRLTFKVANQEEEEESSSQRPKNSIFEDSYKGRAAADLIKDLQTWKALLRCNNVIVGKLENPVVEAESERTATNLYCQAAQELRSIGIPCDVFYLSFDKWIPATWQLGSPPDLTNKTNRSPVKLSIEVDKYSNYRIDLVGRLEGRGTALVFEYRMNGGEVHTQLSMLQQTAQYRQGQQMRHRGLRSPPVGKGVTRDADFAEDNGQAHALTLTPEHQTHFGKELEFFVSSDSKHLKCFVFTIISVPPDTRRKLEQLVPPPSCQQDCEGPSAVRKDSRLICLSPPRLSPADLTENAAHCSHRTPADQCHHFQKSLNNHIPVSHTAECGSDSSLLWISGQQPLPSTSQDPVSSSSIQSTAESVLEVADGGSLQISKDELSVKQSKKKKKKKGKKKTTRNIVEHGDTVAQDCVVVSPEELSTVYWKSSVSPSADVKIHQSSLQGTSSPESMDNSNHVCNSEKNLISSKSKRMAPTVDDNDITTERAAEFVHCEQECCMEASDESQQQKSCPGSCGWQGVSSECKAESNVQGLWSPLQRGAENLSNLGDCQKISGRNVSSNSQIFLESAQSKAGQALSYGLRKAASYCEDSGRLAPVMFLNEVCTTAGAYERVVLSPRKVDNRQTDPAAARNVTSDGRKNSVAHTMVGPPSFRAALTLPLVNGESTQDAKGSVWGGGDVGSRNGGGGGAPPESNGSRGQGKASEDRRGDSSNYTGGNGQSSGRNTQGSGVGGGSTSGGGGGSGSGGGNGNRGGGGGGSNGSGGGGWDCGNDWHWEAEISGKKERRNTVEGEDRSSRNGFVAGGAGSGEYLQRRAPVSMTLDHRVRRGSAGDALHSGSGGSGYVATMLTAGNAPPGKENILVWKPKLNSHEDESLLCEPSRLRIGDYGEGISGPEVPHQALFPNAASASTYGGVPLKSSEKAAYSNGYVVAEGFVSKDALTGISDQNLRRGEEHTYRPVRKVAVTSESGSKVGQSQNVRELNPASVSSDNTFSNGVYFRPRGKEGSFAYVGNSQGQETVKPTWLKKSTPPPNGPDEQPQAASKGGPEVPHQLGNGRGAKYMNIRPLNVQFLQTPTVKETQTSDAFPAFWTRSAPSTPYSQSGEAAFHEGGQSDYHHNLLSGPVLHGRYHMNGVPGSGHFRDSRANQEDSTQRWRPHRRVMLDHDKFGADKERMAPMLPLQKWVPVDKGTTNSQKGSGARSIVEPQVTPASSLCIDSKDSESMVPNSLISQFGCGVSVMEKNITKDICEIKEVNSRSREDASEDGHLPPSKALSNARSITSSEAQYSPVDEVVAGLQNGTVLPRTSVVDQIYPPRRITDFSASVVANCAASLSSRLDSDIQDSNVKSVGVTQLTHSSNDRLTSISTAGSSGVVERGSFLEGDCEIQVIDGAMQKLNLLVTESIQGSSEGREASEAVAMSIGAPLAEIERVLFAVTPTVDPIYPEFLDTSLGQPSTSCDCSTSRSRSNYGQMGFCPCRLGTVPLSAVWQWYEKSSNYGVEVRAIDSLLKGSVSSTYHAYFVPYLSGIQLYGHKGSRSRNGRLGEQGEVDSCPNLDSKAALLLRDLDQGGQGRGSTSAQLLFEFFEADAPSSRQPLVQKVQELLKCKTSTLSRSFGDASCLDSTLLGDLHPASWFAVAWYPIYRISDGPLRSVFLTYHSLHHGVPSNVLCCSLGQPADCPDGRIAFPVVGLEWYNTQAELWLSMGASVNSTLGGQVREATNPSQILKQRLQSLQMTAATMARGVTGGSKHLDYEFFVSRRR